MTRATPTSSDRAVPDYEAALAEGAEGLRIGAPTNYFYDLATDEVRTLMERSLDVFRAAGAKVVEVAVPDIDRINHLSQHHPLVRGVGDPRALDRKPARRLSGSGA